MNNSRHNLKRHRGGSGSLGHTRFDTVYHGRALALEGIEHSQSARPEYGFYSTDEMAKMNAQVGGRLRQQSQNRLVGGSGQLGHTRFDTVYHGRPEYGFYTTDEMTKMNAQVGGRLRQQSQNRLVEGSQSQNRLVGGLIKESMDTHLNRIKGVIENMIDISESPENDIVEVLSNEINPKTNSKYGKRDARNLLDIYIELNPNKQRKLLNNSTRNSRKQLGGNRVTLPLSFYTGEIPNKINVSIPTQNYCA